MTTETPTQPARAALAAVEPATYTVADLARLLTCSERHVWRQIDLGHVPGVCRVGRLVRIVRAIADEWIRSGCPSNRRASR